MLFRIDLSWYFPSFRCLRIWRSSRSMIARLTFVWLVLVVSRCLITALCCLPTMCMSSLTLSGASWTLEGDGKVVVFYIYCLFYEVILLNSRPLCVGTYYYLYQLRWDDQCLCLIQVKFTKITKIWAALDAKNRTPFLWISATRGKFSAVFNQNQVVFAIYISNNDNIFNLFMTVKWNIFSDQIKLWILEL